MFLRIRHLIITLDHRTRLTMPSLKTKLGKKAFYSSASDTGNTLQREIKNAQSGFSDLRFRIIVNYLS